LLAHFKFFALAGAAAALPFSAVSAQVKRPAVPTPAARAARPPAQPQMPPAEPAQQLPAQGIAPPPALAPAAPVPLPPPVWAVSDAQELLAYIQSIGREGLNPADYNPDGLAAAIASPDPARLSEVASDCFDKVASDLALGHVRGDARIDWHIKDPDLDGGRLDQLLHTAVEQHSVTATLTSLLPTHPQYAALKAALAATPPSDVEDINRIKLNLDRWRWLPRDLGSRYIIANVPAYTAALVEDGVTVSRHHAVAGKISTPTPQISAIATGVILNPWWEVPTSISKEVAGKKGFVPVTGPDGSVERWRQPPGPTNALGQLKFVMPNSKAIYLHDTNAKSRFNSKVRAFSHGCIRTQDVLKLATILLEEGDTAGTWTPDKIQAVLASGKTVEANFPRPVPVYIVYMSTAATVDGKIIQYPDVYNRDGKVIEALLDKIPTKAATPGQPADKVATR
jgi:murein L,D-transpeptidase YcbB/YkuD